MLRQIKAAIYIYMIVDMSVPLIQWRTKYKYFFQRMRPYSFGLATKIVNDTLSTAVNDIMLTLSYPVGRLAFARTFAFQSLLCRFSGSNVCGIPQDKWLTHFHC